jgi:hypothetical protein
MVKPSNQPFNRQLDEESSIVLMGTRDSINQTTTSILGAGYHQTLRNSSAAEDQYFTQAIYNQSYEPITCSDNNQNQII